MERDGLDQKLSRGRTDRRDSARVRPRPLAVFACALWALLLAGTCSGPPAELPPPEDAALWVSGVLHVHSEYSDGAGSIEGISRAAAAAGLDFWILTDHWSLDALEAGEEGYRDGVLMLVGVEASTESGHVLGFDLPATPLRFGRRGVDEVLRQIEELGGFAMAAHPDADRDAFRWTGWDDSGYVGMEVFNAYAAYRRDGLISSLAYMFVDPWWQTGSFRWNLAFTPELLERWDRMLPARRLAGWAGADAHGGFEVIGGRFVPLPSYERVFRISRNYLLLDEPLTGVAGRDRELVYRALREGRGFVALDDRGGSDRFRFWAETEGVRRPMGSDVELREIQQPVRFHVEMPVPDVELRILRNGRVVAGKVGSPLEFETREPGVFRAEAMYPAHHIRDTRYEPWIVSNPIAVLGSLPLEARIEAGRSETGDLDALENAEATAYPLDLHVERNSGCRVANLEAGDPLARGFGLDFELGAPSGRVEDTFRAPFARCQVVDSRPVDLTGHAGVRFEVRGDAIYRVNLQLGGPEQASSGVFAGWTTSFLTSAQWQEVVLPFAWFTRIRRADGSLDRSAVSGIRFLFDTSNTKPGTSGRVEVRNFSFLSSP